METIKARVMNRIGTQAEWSAANPIILKGEIALIDRGGVIGVRVGDGVKTFSQLTDNVSINADGAFKGVIDSLGFNPGAQTTPVYYLSTIAGVYPNFGGVELPASSLGVIAWNGTTWVISYTGIDMDGYVKIIDIVNDFDGGVDKALSAEKGKELYERVKDMLPVSYGDFEIVDESDFLAFKIMANGTVEFYKVSDLTAKLIAKAIGIELNDTSGTFSIEDQNGNLAFYINDEGTVEFYQIGEALKTLIINTVIESNVDIKEQNPDALKKYTDINHVITYGQSLSVGQTEIVISDESIYPLNLLCFDGVVRTSPYDKSLTGDTYPTNRRIAFTPLVERVNDGTSAGLLKETPTTGTVEMLATEINKYAFKKFPALQIKLLGTAPSEGATTVSQLSKGGPYYDRLILDVQAGFNLSQAENKQYKVLAVTWTQGESDYINGTGQSSYKALLIALKNDINTDIKAITGQTEDVAFVTYQTATSFGGGVSFPNIALAQLDCALTEDGMYMANAMYQLNYNDAFHLTAASSKLLGCYYGFAINQIITLSKEFKPIHVLNTMRQGNILKAKFHVPVLPLQFEAANGVMLTNKGFQLMKGGIDILTSVELGGDGDSINFLCSEDPTGGLLQYGINVTAVPNSNVNLGNLKDSQGEKEKTVINSVAYNLDNWCPIFEYSL